MHPRCTWSKNDVGSSRSTFPTSSNGRYFLLSPRIIRRLRGRRGFTRQHKNSKRAHLTAPALQTPPKFHEKTSRETEKELKWAGEGKKKREILGLPPFGAPPCGAHPSGVRFFWVWAPPFGPHHDTHTDPNGLAQNGLAKIGQNWIGQHFFQKFGKNGFRTAWGNPEFGSKLCFTQRQETDAKQQPRPNSIFSRAASRRHLIFQHQETGRSDDVQIGRTKLEFHNMQISDHRFFK